MKHNPAVLRLAMTLVVTAITTLIVSTSKAGSQVGFRNEGVTINHAGTNKNGSDDPANHNRGDDRRGQSAIVNRHGNDDPANHDAGDDHGHHRGPGHH